MNRATQQQLIRELGSLALSTRMQQLAESLRREVSKLYRDLGMEFESKWFPVIYILSRKAPLSVIELAEELDYSHPSVIALVRELEKEKLVRSTRDPKDGRRRLLSLTADAFGLVARMRPLWEKIKEVTDELADNDHHLLSAIEAVEVRLNQEDFYSRVITHLEGSGRGLENGLRSGFLIRNATNDDIPAIREIVYTVLREYGLEPDEEGKDSDLIDLQKSYFENDGCFMVLVGPAGDQVVGTLGLARKTNGVCELRKMYLQKERRGLGLGKWMLADAIERAGEMGCRKIVLETIAPLKTAIALYKRFGFKETVPDEIDERVDRAFELDLN